MNVLRLWVRDFRSWALADLEPHSGVNLLLGRNGAGKSNLLEAVHLACLGHSPRTRREVELIRWGSPAFEMHVEGTSAGEPVRLGARCTSEGRKDVRVNGEPGRLFSRLLGHLAVVGLSPDDLELVRGGPQVRRSYLDELLCQLDPLALDELRVLNRVLKQRLAALRDPETFDGDVRAVLDDQLVEAILPVLQRRLKLVEDLRPLVRGLYQHLSGKEDADLAYRGTYAQELDASWSRDSLREVLLHRRQQLRNAESAAQTCLWGPQRDDLNLTISVQAARSSASQGQSRSLAIALRLAAAQLLEDVRKSKPILLLDDVFAELDGPRRERLAALLPQGGQAFLASPRRADLPFEVDRTFLLREGRVEVA
jgi:DNA replication and repair protein RecF